MTEHCRFVSEQELSAMIYDDSLRGHISKNWAVYHSYAESIREMHDSTGEIITIEAIALIASFVRRISTATKLASLERFGYEYEVLVSMISRLFWTYPYLDEYTRDQLTSK